MQRNRQRLPLTALRTFEVAARRLSFKDAADELCVSATTVSNQIRQLERDWNCLLFVRKTRQVVLTDKGQTLARVLTSAFDDIHSAIESHLPQSRKVVTLAVGPIFASRWLIPRLHRFRQKHPDIELVLHNSPRISGASELAVTAAVDWGTGEWAGLDVHPLFGVTYSPVLSPALLERFGNLDQPSDLIRFPVIHQYDRSEWQTWLSAVGLPNLMPLNETTIVDSNVVLQAAIDGQAVVLGSFPLVDKEIADGRLLRPFSTDIWPQRSFHLLTKPGTKELPELLAVCNWLEAEALEFVDHQSMQPSRKPKELIAPS